MKYYLCVLFLASVLACQQSPPREISKGTLVKNVHVVDVEQGRILKDQFIVVDSGRILSITNVLPVGAFKNVIEGNSAYAVPGLTEMHAHIPSPPTSQARIKETLFLYLSGGITTIRGMLGHPYHLQLRDEIDQGVLQGPRIFTSSPSLNGNTVQTPEEAIEKVRQYTSQGYDFLKIHPGILRPVFDSLVLTARTAGIPFAGHVPVDVGIRHALESGYATIDHADGYLEGLVPPEAGVEPGENGFFGFNFTDLADTSRIAALVELTQKQQVWVIPTQTLFERWFAPTTADSLLAQPEMKYMPAETLVTWRRVKEEQLRDPSWDPQKWVLFNEIRLRLIRDLARNGHGILLGSDAPQIFNVPGASLHREISAMQRAGLTPVEILKAGTLNPARFFGEAKVWGSLEEGKAADFFLVEANPLEDLSALRQMTGLMLGGKWLSRDFIDQKLEEIAENAAKEKPE